MTTPVTRIPMPERTKAAIEAWLPYGLASCVLAVSTKLPLHIPEEVLTDFIGTAATMAAIFMGFLATSTSILILYRSTRVSEVLRTTGVMPKLVRYLREAMAWNLAWLISCMTLYFQQSQPLLSAWLSLAALALFCYIRIAVLMSRLIKD